MKIELIAVGRLRQGPERALVDAFLKRARGLGRGVGVRAVEERELTSGDDREAASAALSAAAPKDGRIVLLDERGESPSSRAFAERLAAWRDDGAPAVAMLIGGADGVTDALRQRADLVWAFGRQTWPHLLVRVLAAEQIYRTLTLWTGAPYHRD